MSDQPSEDLTVLLVVGDHGDREVLRRWLEEADGFTPRIVTGDDADPFDDGFDVCLLDVVGLRDRGDELAAHRESTSTYHPTVLYVPEQYGDPDETLARLGSVGDHVDETIPAPIRQASLARRIRTLGRARALSTALAASRNRLERLVSYLPDAVFVCRDGVVAYANPAAEALLAVQPSALEGKDLVDLVPDSDAGVVTAALADATTVGRGGPVEATLTRAGIGETDGGVTDGDAAPSPATTVDADPVPVELTAIDVGEGDVQVIAHDLRNRREREAQLELYRRAMDEATVGITIADHSDDEEVLIYANNTFKQLSGLDDDQLLGHNPRLLQTEATDTEAIARIRAAIDAGEEASAVVLNRRSDGRMWYNALDISPIRNDDCEVTHYLGFQRDVSDRVARDQRLTVLDRVLRHNIRNRLNVVLGYADHIDDVVEAYSVERDGDTDSFDAEGLRAHVDHIRTAAFDVLDLSDSARKFREDVVGVEDADPVDAVAVVEEVSARLAAANDDAELRLSLPDEDVCVSGAAPLMLAVEELLTNAFEHVSEPTVTVSLSVDGDDAVLRVADDGPGITPDSRTPLEYGAETPTEHGQGIGLWLVRWSVDAAGGTVRYEETPGGGTTVVARLPLVEDYPDDTDE